MILSCPACKTTFVVADHVFGTKRRRVRCSQCQHEWVAEPPTNPQPVPATTPPPSTVTPIPAGSNLPAPAKTTGLWQKLWAQHGSKLATASGALLCLYLLTIILSSAGVPMPQFFAPDPTKALVLADVKTRYDTEGTDANGQPQLLLVVEGIVRNTGSEPAPVPPIIVTTKDETGAVLASAVASLQTGTLPPGQSGSFIQTFANPGDNLADITVAFEAKAPHTESHEP